MHVEMCEQSCYQPLKVRIAVSVKFSTAVLSLQYVVVKGFPIALILHQLLDTSPHADCRLLPMRSIAVYVQADNSHHQIIIGH